MKRSRLPLALEEQHCGAVRCRPPTSASGPGPRRLPRPPAAAAGASRPLHRVDRELLAAGQAHRERPSGPAARAAQPAATSPRSGPCRAGQCRRVDRQRQQHLEDRGAVIRRPVLLADDHDLQVGVGLRQVNTTVRTRLYGAFRRPGAGPTGPRGRGVTDERRDQSRPRPAAVSPCATLPARRAGASGGGENGDAPDRRAAGVGSGAAGLLGRPVGRWTAGRYLSSAPTCARRLHGHPRSRRRYRVLA